MDKSSAAELFIRLMKYTGEKEDFFTECITATLRADVGLCKQFLISLCGDEIDGISISDATVTIRTQKEFPDSRIDMEFTVNGLKKLGMENKLWSPEGEGQLAKYLRLGLDRLAFVTGYYTSIDDTVLSDPHYLRPPNGRAHFLWSDFWDLIENSIGEPTASVLNSALLALFAHFAFDPPKPEIGDLRDPDPAKRKSNRRNFAKLWNLTRQGLAERGWKKIHAGTIAELYLRQGCSSNLEKAWLDPTWQRGSLRLRITFWRPVHPEQLAAILPPVRFPFGEHVHIAPVVDTNGHTLDVLISMKKLFAGVTEREAMSERLAEFVLPVFDLIEDNKLGAGMPEEIEKARAVSLTH